jgi:N-acetylmuramoyl-L-alanine amidase
MIDIPSPNFDARPEDVPIDMLVIHYTGMQSAEAALARMCDPGSEVSAHYMIDEDGTVHPLVAEDCRAWHAGVSFWRGETDINARSIGIELVNPGHEFGYRSFPEAQMAALIGLAKDILERHPIPARNVVGHSDIAPRRKEDPGELFDWKRLAADGIGIWPSGKLRGGAKGKVETLLATIGYETVNIEKTVTAFQRRYRPARYDGIADEETVGLIEAVVAQSATTAP